MELCKNVSDRTKLKVTDEEIDNISISNLGFVYDGKGIIYFEFYFVV